MGTTYGYARVSSRDQNEDRQLDAFDTAMVPKENIYVDKQSGKDFLRPMYTELLGKIKKDDLIYIKSIDRLGRNYTEILSEWRVLTKEIGVDIVVIDMPLLDTRIGRDLIGTFISDVVLQVLSFVAENERENIRRRQAEGIALAKARGVKFGRPKKRLPKSFYEMYKKWKNGEISGKEAARVCKMPLTTFLCKAKAIKKKEAL